MLFSLVFVSHHPCSRRASLPLRNLSVRCLPRLGRGAENFLSFRSSLIPRHSPLTTKSFTIRTSKTPLPQLLYNPHLQAPLGSAGNKGLITPLESALTKNSPVTSLESALTKTGGWGVLPAVQTILFRWKILPAETASAPRAERPRWHRVPGNAGAAVREL